MAKFVGRSDHLLLFTSGDRGVITDSVYGMVVASGKTELLTASLAWDDGEFSEADENLAVASLAALDSAISEPTGRLYTVPRGVQSTAKRALQQMNTYQRGGTEVSVHTASLLASGGQVNFEKLRHISKYFARHENDQFSEARNPEADGTPSATSITWGLWGGDTAQKWASTIIHREADKAITADGGVVLDAEATTADPFLDAYLLDPESGPDFLARVRLDGSGIDRLYKIEIDGHVYVWDDGTWDNLGDVHGDIYGFDRALDDPADTVGKTHVVIDPSSAIIIGAHLQAEPFTCISIEDIDAIEAKLAADAGAGVDWSLLSAAMIAAAPPVDDTPHEYTDEERAANAGKQVRDKNGKFAVSGSRVMVGGNPSTVGNITKVNPANGTVNVKLDSGQDITVPGNTTEGVGQFTATVPGEPVVVPRVDTTGILAEPRTPINRIGAQIPGTLPAMTSDDLHNLLYDWPAWVKGQRDAYKDVAAPIGTHVQAKNSLDVGDAGRAMQEATGSRLMTDATTHPLISKWLKKTDRHGHKTSIWYQPIQASGEPSKPKELTPDTSDVQPVYMAIVAPDDPRAVTALISLVPVSSVSTAPMTYTREDGKWVRDPKTLADLNSATPPPVVPLDEDSLQDVLQQVDSTQEDQPLDDPQMSIDEYKAAAAATPPAPAPVTAAGYPSLDQALMVLFGPDEDLLPAITAAGGLDRNRGQAEKLRRYWTVGVGGAKIRWNTGGDWTRCVRHLSKYMGERSKGYCSLRHKEMTAMWPGDKDNRAMASRLDGTFSTDYIVPESEFVNRVTMKARAAQAQARVLGNPNEFIPDMDPVARADRAKTVMQSLTAAGRMTGAHFIIPLVLPLGLESGDKRLIDIDADIDIRDLPLPLLWQPQTGDGHDGSYVVGRIDSIENTDTGVRNARGVFDTSALAREAERMVREGFLRKCSADMDQFEAQDESVLAEDGKAEKPGKISAKRTVVNKARIMAVTIVAKPAFQEVEIFLEEDDQTPQEEENVLLDGIYVDDVDPLVASALVAAGYVAENIPVAPPEEWFGDPKLERLTPITVTDDGRVYGHIAEWGQPHIGMSGDTKPPHSHSGYSYFQTGVLRTEQGSDVTVGQLTLAGGHAAMNFSARQAVRHYDDTASAVADVRAGEDRFGIWVSGGLRPGTTPEQIRVLRASAPSGDWRRIRGQLELVAICQVNVPGFPIARTLVAGGQQMALVAAGALALAKLQSDPVTELSQRLEKLEQFASAELDDRVAPLRAKFASARAERDAELAAKAEKVAARFSELTDFAYTPVKQRPAPTQVETLTASVDALRARIATFQTQAEKNRQQEAERLAKEVNPTIVDAPDTVVTPSADDARPKYTPKTQPRDEQGKFRLILARLRDNLGTTGNQAIMDKIKTVENLDNAGNYKEASKSAADLINTIDRIDTRALDPDSIGTVRLATTELSKVVANLPLPFDDQTQKIRFSDLPPVLRELTQTLIKKVEEKIGKKDAAVATANLRNFMSGADLYSQSDVSSQLNRMLRLLT